MRFENVLFLCLGGVLGLAPLTFYLFWLCSITRRSRPTVVSGTWDFAALLCGLFGLIVVGGALLLYLTTSSPSFALRGNWSVYAAALQEERTIWRWVSRAFGLAVVGVALAELVSRRKSLVVYNIDPALFEQTLAEIFEQLGQPLERQGDIWFSTRKRFRLDAFAAGRNVTLRWLDREDPVLFQEVERRLRQIAPSLDAAENPVTKWLTTAAVVGLVVTAVCFALIFLLLR